MRIALLASLLLWSAAAPAWAQDFIIQLANEGSRTVARSLYLYLPAQ